jgi:hypothetical protein
MLNTVKKPKDRITINNKRKGQAAIEFLVTYGWAILGAMIAIGALSYFGIFNTQRYVSDVCYFGDQITCEDYIAYNNGTVGLILRNNFGVNIDINSTTFKSDYGTVICNTSDRIIPQLNIEPGDTFNITCNITSTTIPTNSKLKYKTIITFQRTTSDNLHNQTGDVTVTVQKKP